MEDKIPFTEMEEKIMDQSRIPSFASGGKSVFLNVDPAEIAPYIILCVRDPLCFSDDPVQEFSEFFDRITSFNKTALFTTFSGLYKETPITVCFTGSGGPDTELALMELIMSSQNANTFIRLGASGGFQPWVRIGEFILTLAAVRDEGCSKEYVSPIYPAVAHFEVLLAQIEAFEKRKLAYHVGVTRSLDSMYPGLGRASKDDYLQDDHRKLIEYWSKARVLNIDRETSVILTLTTLFGLRGGSACIIVDNYFTGEIVVQKVLKEKFHEGARAVLDSLHVLSTWDKKKSEKGKNQIYPSLLTK